MFQVLLTNFGQTLVSELVNIDGIILLYDTVDVATLNSISSYSVQLDEEACGNLKNNIGNVFIRDLSNSQYQAKTILFYKNVNNEKKIVAGYSQETPLVQKTTSILSIYLTFDFSVFTNGFLFASIQAGYSTASHNADGLLHLENPNIDSDDDYAVYSKSQIDDLLKKHELYYSATVQVFNKNILVDYRDNAPQGHDVNTRYKGNDVNLGIDQYVELHENTRVSVYVAYHTYVGSIAFLSAENASTYIAYPVYFRGHGSTHNASVPAGSVLRLTFRQNAFDVDFYDLADFGVEHEPIVRVGKVVHNRSYTDYTGALVGIRADNGKFDNILTVSKTTSYIEDNLLDMAPNSPIYVSFSGECFSSHPRTPFGFITNLEYLYENNEQPSANNILFIYVADGVIIQSDTEIRSHIVTNTKNNQRYFHIDSAPVYLLLSEYSIRHIAIGGLPDGYDGVLLGIQCEGAENAGLIKLVQCNLPTLHSPSARILATDNHDKKMSADYSSVTSWDNLVPSISSSSDSSGYDLGTNTQYWKNVYANKYIVRNGTSSQFLKADGSIDSNTYLTSSDLPTNHVTTDTYQEITGTKVFNTGSSVYGDKIIFKTNDPSHADSTISIRSSLDSSYMFLSYLIYNDTYGVSVSNKLDDSGNFIFHTENTVNHTLTSSSLGTPFNYWDTAYITTINGTTFTGNARGLSYDGTVSLAATADDTISYFNIVPFTSESVYLGEFNAMWAGIYACSLQLGSYQNESDYTVYASLQLYNDASEANQCGIDVTGNLNPYSTSTFSLGNVTYRWKSLYADNIYVGTTSTDLSTYIKNTTVTNATNATNVYISTSASSVNYPLVFTTNVTAGNKSLYTDSSNSLYYNPSSDILYTPSILPTTTSTSTATGFSLGGTSNIWKYVYARYLGSSTNHIATAYINSLYVTSDGTLLSTYISQQMAYKLSGISIGSIRVFCVIVSPNTTSLNYILYSTTFDSTGVTDSNNVTRSVSFAAIASSYNTSNGTSFIRCFTRSGTIPGTWKVLHDAYMYNYNTSANVVVPFLAVRTA